MPTYLIKREIHLIRQEGDTAEITFVVPAVIDMSIYQVRFMVTSKNRQSLFLKDSALAEITITDQTITIPLLQADTKLRAGDYRWEIELYNVNERITAGKGNFQILGEFIR